MHRYGLKTCADIREWELHDLIRRFGKFGVVLHERARQRRAPVQPSRIRKSISVETTFGEDLAGPTVWEPTSTSSLSNYWVALSRRMLAKAFTRPL